MKNSVLNHLDSPISFAGISLMQVLGFSIALFPGIFFESFSVFLGGVVLFFLVGRFCKRLAPFFFARLFYRIFPHKILGKKGENLVQSHITKWVK